MVQCNARVTEITGFTHDYLVGKSAINFVAESHRQECIENYRPLILQHKGVVRFETCYIKENGEFPAAYSINTIPNEHYLPIGFVGIIRDLTEKKQMEQNLLRSQRLAAIGD